MDQAYIERAQKCSKAITLFFKKNFFLNDKTFGLWSEENISNKKFILHVALIIATFSPFFAHCAKPGKRLREAAKAAAVGTIFNFDISVDFYDV